MPKKRNKEILVFLLVVCGIILTVLYGIYLHRHLQTEKIKRQQKIAEQETQSLIENIQTKMDSLVILADSVYVYDATLARVIYAKNDSEILPLASLSKIMAAIVALEDAGTSSISVSNAALEQKGEYGLAENEVWSKNALIKFGLVTSSNDAFFAIGESSPYFLDNMNQKAKSLGLWSMRFNNVTGLDINKAISGAYGNARDLSQLAWYAYTKYPETFQATTEAVLKIDSISGFTHNIKNTNLSLNKIPNVLFSKTGLTDIAGGNLSIIFETPNHHKIVVTFLASTPLGRFSDIEKIVDVLYYEYSHE